MMLRTPVSEQKKVALFNCHFLISNVEVPKPQFWLKCSKKWLKGMIAAEYTVYLSNHFEVFISVLSPLNRRRLRLWNSSWSIVWKQWQNFTCFQQKSQVFLPKNGSSSHMYQVCTMPQTSWTCLEIQMTLSE